MSKDELNERSERTFSRARYVLNDQQEYCLKKVVNAWKNYRKEKYNPNSNLRYRRLLKILDETIQKEKGQFLSEEVFESRLHPLVYIQYQKLAQAERSTGFKSLVDQQNPTPNKFLNNFRGSSNEFGAASADEHFSTSNGLEFDHMLVLRKPVLLKETGEIYFGYWTLKGEMHGYAKIIRNGLLYEGEWNNEKEGNCANARVFYANGTFFQGNLSYYLPNNKGTLSNFDDCFYSGEWLNGEYDGRGCLSISKLCRYEGQFKNSALHGEGKLIYESAAEGIKYNYNGEFENNRFNSFGNLQYYGSIGNNAEEYTGSWKNGVPSGKGTYMWPNGCKYDGNYEDGKKRGQGKYTYNLGKSYYEGSWSNGKPNGKGVIAFASSDSLESHKGPAPPALKIAGIWKLGKAQKIDSEAEFKKLNSDESKLAIPIESEIFSNEFNLNIQFVTPKKNDLAKIFNDKENAKLKFAVSNHQLTREFGKGIYNNAINIINGKR